MADFEFNVEEAYAELSTNAKGWSKQLTKVSWNGRPGKYDIRDWAPDYSKMGKGVTFTPEELKVLRDTLNKMDLD
ncbi:YdbC family protein [Hutsoniella sourekii]|uniref:YdbC family protein n=1 Tax=Hutsoniella sourekii TaxID=87650 RepID=UPI0004872E44|nr:YdbC family protein [Hutsoniella sourekii]